MNSSRYPLYAMGIVAAGGFALWAGLSPLFLIFLACPLMMFFMMRGMHGDMHGDAGSPNSKTQGSRPVRPADLDGSHERIERP